MSDIVVVARAGSRVVLELLADNIIGFLPESIDTMPYVGGKVAAGRNVGEVEFAEQIKTAAILTLQLIL